MLGKAKRTNRRYEMSIVSLMIGFVIGVAVMYLIARNSPEHFLKFKKYADAAYSKVKKVTG